jgi:hypothetical protein
MKKGEIKKKKVKKKWMSVRDLNKGYLDPRMKKEMNKITPAL